MSWGQNRGERLHHDVSEPLLERLRATARCKPWAGVQGSTSPDCGRKPSRSACHHGTTTPPLPAANRNDLPPRAAWTHQLEGDEKNHLEVCRLWVTSNEPAQFLQLACLAVSEAHSPKRRLATSHGGRWINYSEGVLGAMGAAVAVFAGLVVVRFCSSLFVVVRYCSSSSSSFVFCRLSFVVCRLSCLLLFVAVCCGLVVAC